MGNFGSTFALDNVDIICFASGLAGERKGLKLKISHAGGEGHGAEQGDPLVDAT